MPTIFRASAERLTVAEAKQLILGALPPEHGGGRIFGSAGPDGEPVWDFESLALVAAAEAHAPYLDRDFLDLCKSLGFEPHMMYSPAIAGYSGSPAHDNSYMLTHAQLVKLAESYSLEVKIDAKEASRKELVPAQSDVVGSDASPEHWKMRVQAEAADMFVRLRKSGANPTVYSILDDLVRWCAKNDVRTKQGVIPKAAYLRVHVLSGKHWTPPR